MSLLLKIANQREAWLEFETPTSMKGGQSRLEISIGFFVFDDVIMSVYVCVCVQWWWMWVGVSTTPGPLLVELPNRPLYNITSHIFYVFYHKYHHHKRCTNDAPGPTCPCNGKNAAAVNIRNSAKPENAIAKEDDCFIVLPRLLNLSRY